MGGEFNPSFYCLNENASTKMSPEIISSLVFSLWYMGVQFKIARDSLLVRIVSWLKLSIQLEIVGKIERFEGPSLRISNSRNVVILTPQWWWKR